MKSKELRSLGIKLLSLIFVLVGISCGQKTSESTSGDNGEEFVQAESQVKDQIETVVFDIPSPSEIPFLLEATGAEFNESLLNDINKADSYAVTNDVAAINLGVYSADIGYLISYDKVQEALNYLTSTKDLADHLGVTGSVNVELLKRFEGNLANKDSLAFILDQAITETDSFLKDDNRNRMAALLIVGSFVEGLYISTELIRSYPKNLLPEDSRILVLTPLMRVILEQEKSLDDLLSLLNTIEQVNPVGQIKDDLLTIQALYKELNITEQIENSRPDLVITDKTLSSITKKVAAVRKSLVDL